MDSDGPSSASAIARSAMSTSPGATSSAADGAPVRASSPACSRASSSRRSASSDGSHSHVVVDAGQAAVVQLVAAVERELEVLVGQRVAPARARGSAAERVDGPLQRGEQLGGQRSAGFGEGQHGDGGLPGEPPSVTGERVGERRHGLPRAAGRRTRRAGARRAGRRPAAGPRPSSSRAAEPRGDRREVVEQREDRLAQRAGRAVARRERPHALDLGRPAARAAARPRRGARRATRRARGRPR